MQTTATRTAGSHTDLLTGILNVQVRNVLRRLISILSVFLFIILFFAIIK